MRPAQSKPSAERLIIRVLGLNFTQSHIFVDINIGLYTKQCFNKAFSIYEQQIAKRDDILHRVSTDVSLYGFLIDLLAITDESTQSSYYTNQAYTNRDSYRPQVYL